MIFCKRSELWNIEEMPYELPEVVRSLTHSTESQVAFEEFHHAPDYLIPPPIMVFKLIAISHEIAFPRTNRGIMDLFTLVGKVAEVVGERKSAADINQMKYFE
jgi:hypothetical protein